MDEQAELRMFFVVCVLLTPVYWVMTYRKMALALSLMALGYWVL